MKDNMEFKKTDPKVSRLIQATYPNYKGRRPVRVQSRSTYTISDYWDGGSRYYSEFVDSKTGRRLPLESLKYEHQFQSNPFNLKIGKIELTPNVAVVENSIFCGKDMGIRIYLHPDTYKEWEQNNGE